MLRQESELFAIRRNKLFGSKFEGHFHKKAKLKAESERLSSSVPLYKQGKQKSFVSRPSLCARGGGQSVTLFQTTTRSVFEKRGSYLKNFWNLEGKQIYTDEFFPYLIIHLNYVHLIVKSTSSGEDSLHFLKLFKKFFKW